MSNPWVKSVVVLTLTLTLTSMARPSYRSTLRDDRCPPFPSHGVAQNCNLVHHKLPRSGRPFFTTTAPSTASMTSTQPHQAVRSLLSGVNPSLSVRELEAVPSSRVQLQYNVKVSDGPSLLLTLPPPAVMRLLRSEELVVESEIAVLKWLTGSATETKNRAGQREGQAHGSRSLNAKTSKGSYGQAASKALLEYLPVLVRHGSIDENLAIEYNLSRPPRGVAISSLSRPLSHRERKAVSFQTGQLLRRISTQLSPNGRFGLAADVLSVPPSTALQQRLEGGLNSSRGGSSWSIAFQSMLESVLRDAEDLSVMLSYGAIRRHADRFEHFLDAVREPRLVVIDAGEDPNTLVLRPRQREESCLSRSKNTKEKVKPLRPKGRAPEKRECSEESSEEPDMTSDDEEGYDSETNHGRSQIEVTGLRQWSNCIFGDPLMAQILTHHPLPDLWHALDTPDSLIEDEPHAHIRLLLYECYHAVVAVVREFYRPQPVADAELVARKQLACVLRRLDELDDEGIVRRRRRCSGEVSPAKRARQSEEGDSDW